MKFSHSVVLSVVLACGLPAFDAECAMTAGAFVRELYKPYETENNPEYLGKSASLIFAPHILNLIRADQKDAKGEVGKLDEDPICACQDSDGFRLSSIKIYRLSAHRKKSTVSFSLGVERRVVTLDLIEWKGSWRVTDVHTEEVPSLISFLSHR